MPVENSLAVFQAVVDTVMRRKPNGRPPEIRKQPTRNNADGTTA